MLSLSAQSYQLGFVPTAVPAVDGAKNVAPLASAVLNVSQIAGERNIQRGGVNGRLDEIQVGKLTNFQGGHRHELAVDSFSTVDSLGLDQNFDLGNGLGSGYSNNNKKLHQAALDATSETMVSNELNVLSGHIVLVFWQSIELLLAPIWKMLLGFMQKVLGINVPSYEELTGIEQPVQSNKTFELSRFNKAKKQPFNIF